MNTVHIYPINDLVDHDNNDDCVCGPRVETVAGDDGSISWVVVHHSLDAREKTCTECGHTLKTPAPTCACCQEG